MFDWSAWKRARSYLATGRLRVVAAHGCALVSAACLLALVLLLGWLGELLLTPEHSLQPLVQRSASAWYGPAISLLYTQLPVLQDTALALWLLVVVAVLLSGVRSICHYAQSRLVAGAVVDATHRIRRAIYNQAYRLGTTEVSGIGAAPAINVFTRDTDQVRDGLIAWLNGWFREPVKIVLLVLVALLAAWYLALLFLVLAAMGTFLAMRQIESARGRAAAAIRSAAERLALLQESLFQIRLTRGYLMESSAQSRFERNLGQFTVSELRRLHSSAAVGPLIEFVAVLCVALVVGLASFNLILGSLSPSSTVVLYASLISLYWPAMTLSAHAATVRRGAEAATALFTFLDQHAQLGQVADASFLSPMSRSLDFVNVTVQEPGQPPVLDSITLTIRAGTRTAIMGLDERARRALVYLIPRFIDPTVGQVRVDSQDVRLVTLESLRAQVALVLQDELIFTDTVAANIGCGDISYGLPHIIDAAKIAHVHNFVQRLPKGYDTIIGDQGEILTLSQQFRIALARAILRDPTIVIIEEPKTQLDEDTKHWLDDTLLRFCRGRTVLFLPHRLSTIRSCDSIVLLHDGKVETVGNHRDLTLSSELYRHLQYTEFNVFAAS